MINFARSSDEAEHTARFVRVGDCTVWRCAITRSPPIRSNVRLRFDSRFVKLAGDGEL